MNETIAGFAKTLIDEGYFDDLPKNDRLFYKNSKLRKENLWYEKCRVAAELLAVEEKLDDLIDCYCEDATLHSLLENKKTIWVSSIPNTKFSLVDYFFCRYLEQQHPHLTVELVKLVPIDDYLFGDFDEAYLGRDATHASRGSVAHASRGSVAHASRGSVAHEDCPRPKKYIINISESEAGKGHLFVCDEKGVWR